MFFTHKHLCFVPYRAELVSRKLKPIHIEWLSVMLTLAAKYSHIPTIGGPSYPLFSYIGSIRFLLRGSSLMREGCTRVSLSHTECATLFTGRSPHQYRGKIFKIALFDRWLAVVTDSSLVDELRKLPEDDMSLRDAASEVSLWDTFKPCIWLTMLTIDARCEVLFRQGSHRRHMACGACPHSTHKESGITV